MRITHEAISGRKSELETNDYPEVNLEPAKRMARNEERNTRLFAQWEDYTASYTSDPLLIICAEEEMHAIAEYMDTLDERTQAMLDKLLENFNVYRVYARRKYVPDVVAPLRPLSQFIEKLSDIQYRRVLLMLDGLNLHEVAEAEGVSYTTMESCIDCIRKKYQKHTTK